MKLYVASSWRNELQPQVVEELRVDGHEVYDFRHPPGGDHLGFSWSDVDPDWPSWTPEEYVAALDHPIAQAGFDSDFGAMEWAEGCVLILKSGRSAHLEAGWFVGRYKPVWIVLDPDEFGRDTGHHVTELMYKMADGIFTSIGELRLAIADRVYCRAIARRNQIDSQLYICEEPRSSAVHDTVEACDQWAVRGRCPDPSAHHAFQTGATVPA